MGWHAPSARRIQAGRLVQETARSRLPPMQHPMVQCPAVPPVQWCGREVSAFCRRKWWQHLRRVRRCPSQPQYLVLHRYIRGRRWYTEGKRIIQVQMELPTGSVGAWSLSSRSGSSAGKSGILLLLRDYNSMHYPSSLSVFYLSAKYTASVQEAPDVVRVSGLVSPSTSILVNSPLVLPFHGWRRTPRVYYPSNRAPNVSAVGHVLEYLSKRWPFSFSCSSPRSCRFLRSIQTPSASEISSCTKTTLFAWPKKAIRAPWLSMGKLTRVTKTKPTSSSRFSTLRTFTTCAFTLLAAGNTPCKLWTRTSFHANLSQHRVKVTLCWWMGDANRPATSCAIPLKVTPTVKFGLRILFLHPSLDWRACIQFVLPFSEHESILKAHSH